MKARNILVTGRCWRDQILLNLPVRTASAKRLAKRQTIVQRLAGSVTIHSFIKACCEGIDGVTVVRPQLPNEEDPSGGPRLAQSYWMWSPYPRSVSDDTQVWRLDTGFGYVDSDFRNDYQKLQGGDSPVDNIHVLVLDDNDFHRGSLTADAVRAFWPEVGKDCPVPDDIVLRAGANLKGTQRWEKLSSAYKDRLTVVIPLSALRTWGATVAPARSWDCTLAEIWYELAHNPLLSSLWACRRIVIHFGAAGAAVFERGVRPLCVYDPLHLEGSLERTWPGDFPGYSSIYTTAMVMDIIRKSDDLLTELLTRAVGAVRENHLCGGGIVGQDVQQSWKHLIDLVAAHLRGQRPRVERVHSVALGLTVPCTPDASNINLISLITENLDYNAIAHRVVLEGPERGLAQFPRLRFGKYWSVDRDEIERLNTLRTVLQEFDRAPASVAPLSIAVFGPPGSGKSFSVKEVSAAVFGETNAFLTFNLSELSEDELPAAFHQIRDERLRGRVPVVFWDEFDTGGLKWLRHFLAPMNDAEFWEGGRMHPVGKAVFVFAGSMEATFLAFRETVARNKEEFPTSLKATDFISRLGGFFDVKGPGVMSGGAGDGISSIRRALLFRSTLEQLYPHLIEQDGDVRHARVDPSVTAGFIGVKQYLHGARSLRAIVAMSALHGHEEFGASVLPPADQLALHASDDFLEVVRKHQAATGRNSD